ncbi:hypothetical protein E4U42_002447 [Claviceps africana]|uniref:Uncharacterized protein n=1 Tax=Claviceps africana TaxID=83212 RepID=A0A8K0J8Q4_9HYPO|nr:hypothetical protein E4U42_002447 [Claviceps africana]
MHIQLVQVMLDILPYDFGLLHQGPWIHEMAWGPKSGPRQRIDDDADQKQNQSRFPNQASMTLRAPILYSCA